MFKFLELSVRELVVQTRKRARPSVPYESPNQCLASLYSDFTSEVVRVALVEHPDNELPVIVHHAYHAS